VPDVVERELKKYGKNMQIKFETSVILSYPVYSNTNMQGIPVQEKTELCFQGFVLREKPVPTEMPLQVHSITLPLLTIFRGSDPGGRRAAS
jgi:hypothetical protein